jgi:hypothetical protein
MRLSAVLGLFVPLLVSACTGVDTCDRRCFEATVAASQASLAYATEQYTGGVLAYYLGLDPATWAERGLDPESTSRLARRLAEATGATVLLPADGEPWRCFSSQPVPGSGCPSEGAWVFIELKPPSFESPDLARSAASIRYAGTPSGFDATLIIRQLNGEWLGEVDVVIVS